MNRPTEAGSVAIPVDLAREPDFALGALQVRPSLRRVICQGREEAVQPRVMQVLVALARARGEVVSREDLVETCWDGVVVGDDSITHSIAKVRQLADCGDAQAFDIETIPRVGYRLRAAAGAATDSAAPKTSRRFSGPPRTYAAIASGVFLLAVLAFAGWKYMRPGPGAGEPSIAVLPFKNLSSDKDAGYLAAGVQDEILTRLAKIGSLKVVSRTSTDQFADRSANVRQIAKELGVANVLEGNVQKSGNNIRINVQLIRAATDEHLWAEDYDRKAGDLFSVESEVARAIASALAAKITPGEKAEIAARPTNDPRAYDLYLRGLAFAHKDDADSAIRLFRQSVTADPKFAVAWAQLARMQAWAGFGDDPAVARRGAAHAALAKALELNPDLAEVQAAKGFYLYYGEMNYPAAEHQLERVHARWPNNADALEALALVLRREGKWQESTDAFVKLVALDPLVPSHRILLAWNFIGMHDYAAALRVVDGALEIWPDNARILAAKASAYQFMGQLDLAGAVLEKMHPTPGNTEVFDAVWGQFWLKRKFGNCAAYFKGSLDQDPDTGAGTTALLRVAAADCLRRAGDAKGARENYSRALALILGGLKAHPNNMDFLNLLPIVYSGLGDPGRAMAAANRAIEVFRASNDVLEVVHAEFARLQVMSAWGDRGAAIAQLARLMNLPEGPTPALLRLDPQFDRLRGDPRFEALAHGKDVELSAQRFDGNQ